MGMIPKTWPRVRRWWRRRSIRPEGMWARWKEVSEDVSDNPTMLRWVIEWLSDEVREECDWLGLKTTGPLTSKVSTNHSDFEYRHTAAVLVEVRYVKL